MRKLKLLIKTVKEIILNNQLNRQTGLFRICFKQKDVRMFLLLSVVFVVFLQTATGGTYCSLNDTNIHCVPCNGNCMSTDQKCFLCPKQCGKSNNCKGVCKPTCRNQTCEYMEGYTVPVCTRGCIQGFTGKRCQEYCSEECKECDQNTGKICTSCMEGPKGDKCNLDSLSSISAAQSPSTIMTDCTKECDFCNDPYTICEKCTDARKCQHPCGCYRLRLRTNSTSSSDETESHKWFWYQTSIITAAVAVAAAVAAMLIICIAMICYRKRSKYREMKRNNQQLPEMEEMSFPRDIASTSAMGSDTDPYACIEVFDRDCVPEHLLQAAMVTAPPIVTQSPFQHRH